MPQLQTINALLNEVLANTYVIYVKTQSFHWNVTDPRFYSLHKMLEEQYEGLADIIDTTAERIRMVGGTSPGSMHQFIELSTLQEVSTAPSTEDFISLLLSDHEQVSKDLRSKIKELDSDPGTQDLLVQNLRTHEKYSWMLKSSL